MSPPAKQSGRRSTAARDLPGDGVLYHYLEKELQTRDVFLFQMLAARLVSDLGVWLHPSVYQRLPILLPHVIRDETARGRSNGVEMWAAPNPNGELRDDNSLIKESVKSLPIEAPATRVHYRGRRIGRAGGWVASHVWQLRADGGRASRHHTTNTFVPNLVWLPKAVSRLTDRQGAFVQRFTQAMSIAIYKDVQVHHSLAGFVANAWSALPPPTENEIPSQAVPKVTELNFFVPGEAWFAGRVKALQQVSTGLDGAAAGETVAGRPSRYFAGLAALDPGATKDLRSYLAGYLAAVGAV